LTQNKHSAIINHMVNYSFTSLDSTFAALADPTRRAILARLAHGAASVTELAKPFQISLPAISRHLRVLEKAGLLAREREGRIHRCRLKAEPMKRAAEWMAAYQPFWEGQFDALAGYLAETSQEEAG
jgi:DNA-binding transcriptional ArsR family regulator